MSDQSKIDLNKQTILIENNQFIQNFAYFSTVAIHIRRYDPSFNSFVNGTQLYLPCGGILI